ncbi:MAG: hypothetical protein O3C40_32290 [Planctomycetota bacterium]|nr:hypothetical protein [Planctomycetota bacterium]
MEYRDCVFAGVGKRQFTLSEDNVSVRKGRENVTLPLKDLESEYRTVRRRVSLVFLLGCIGLVVGLAFLVYGLVFDSEDIAELRSHPEQAEALLRRQVTVQVDSERPVTGVVTTMRPADDVRHVVNGELQVVHQEPQLEINSTFYPLREVIHAKADRTQVFAQAAVWGALGLLILCSSWRKVEYAVFRNTTGIDAIAIARAGPDTSRFDPFVDELSRRIVQAKDDEGGCVN